MMKWTTKYPVKAGWYWVRRPSNHALTSVREVVSIAGKFFVRMDNATMPIPEVVKHYYGEWAGPIPEPDEDEERKMKDCGITYQIKTADGRTMSIFCKLVLRDEHVEFIVIEGDCKTRFFEKPHYAITTDEMFQEWVEEYIENHWNIESMV